MSEMTPTERLDAIEARAAAATEGPWDTDGGGTSVGTGDEWIAHVVDHAEPMYPSRKGDAPEPVQARADAEFIAHARTDVPEMATALRSVLALAGDVSRQRILVERRDGYRVEHYDAPLVKVSDVLAAILEALR